MAISSPSVEYLQNPVVLSGREMEVLNLVIEGKTSKEVATRLYLSKRTVDSHLSKIYEKLSVTNKVQAIRRAAELGLIANYR